MILSLWSFTLCKEHSKRGEEREGEMKREKEYHLDAVIDYANYQDPWIYKGLHLGIEKSPYARFHLLTGPAAWFTLGFINLLTVEEAEIVIGSESKGVSSGPCGWGRKPQTDRDRKKERWRKSMLRCHLVPLLLIILCSLLVLTHCRRRAYINILIKPQLVVALTVLFLSVRCKIWIGH